MRCRNEDVPQNRRMQFRIGINLGDVIHDDVRIAAQLILAATGSKARNTADGSSGKMPPRPSIVT
jgi:class 3 adenylate cyclase